MGLASTRSALRVFEMGVTSMETSCMRPKRKPVKELFILTVRATFVPGKKSVMTAQLLPSVHKHFSSEVIGRTFTGKTFAEKFPNSNEHDCASVRQALFRMFCRSKCTWTAYWSTPRAFKVLFERHRLIPPPKGVPRVLLAKNFGEGAT